MLIACDIVCDGDNACRYIVVECPTDGIFINVKLHAMGILVVRMQYFTEMVNCHQVLVGMYVGIQHSLSHCPQILSHVITIMKAVERHTFKL